MEKPYTLRSTGRWPFRNHQIMFEDTPVVFSCNDHELASRVVAALNGAYNLGRMRHEVAVHAAANDKPVSGDGMVCEGSCERHRGEVKRVHVRSETYDWGEFDYCSAAIAEDRRRGLSVDANGFKRSFTDANGFKSSFTERANE